MWYINIILMNFNLSANELNSNKSVCIEVCYQDVLQNYI